MRGKPVESTLSKWYFGITPAQAGKTESWIRNVKIVEDHPRACGENSDFFTLYYGIAGSPPRMRGKQNKHFKRARDSRITPAHAGKTFCHTFFAGRVKDHPRACGENSISHARSSA